MVTTSSNSTKTIAYAFVAHLLSQPALGNKLAPDTGCKLNSAVSAFDIFR